MRQRYTTATRSMNQPANAAREKKKGKGKGRGMYPGAKTVNRTHGAARPGPVPGSKNNQVAPRRASPFHTPYAQGISTPPPVQGSSTSSPEIPEIPAAPAACGPTRELSERFGTDAVQGSSTSSPVPQQAPEVPGSAAASAACGTAKELSGRFGTNAIQGSSASSPVPQQTPEVQESVAASAACGPARELSGRFGTNADFIQRLTPQDNFAAIVMSRVNGRMKRKGHGSKHCVSGKLDGGSPWFYPDDPIEAAVPDCDTHLMRPIFLCVWEFLDKDIKAPSCPRCRTPNTVMCRRLIVYKRQLNIRSSNHPLLKSELVFAVFSSAVFYKVQVRMDHCKQ